MEIPPGAFDAKHLSPAAKQVCRQLGITPRWYKVLNPHKPADGNPEKDGVYDVLEVGNSKRTEKITNADIVIQLGS